MKKVFFYLKNIFISTRPTTWIRIFAEMFLGFAFAQASSITDFFRFFIGFISVGPLLWSGAYILNDITDITYDSQHVLRKKRPIAQKVLSVKLALVTVIILFILSFLLGMILGNNFFIGLLILLISQILYTVKPFRLKEKFPFDILLNSINSATRFTLGYLVVNQSLVHIPIFFLIFTVIIKLILFLGHRLQNRKIEVNNKFKSTIAILSINRIKIFIFILSFLAIFFYIFSVIIYNLKKAVFFPLIMLIVTVLPVFYAIKNGYLYHEEQNISWRVYLYIILALFSILVFFAIKF